MKISLQFFYELNLPNSHKNNNRKDNQELKLKNAKNKLKTQVIGIRKTSQNCL